MSNQFKGMARRSGIARVRSMIQNYMHQLFSLEGRRIFRQIAIRKAIASLIETERMRLAMTIAHRDHN